MIILVSHGNYAKETLTSCEMITGKITNIATVSFHDPMGVKDVVQKYENFYNTSGDENFYIITDIRNGTPANAAVIFQQKHNGVRIFSGLSLSLLLTIATGTDIDDAIVQNREAMAEIRPKGSSSRRATKKLSNKEPENTEEKQKIVNIRVDSRLIHGQVATMWTQKLSATRIMVIDDEIVKSKIQKTTLKTAVPRGVHLSILTGSGAAKRFKEQQYKGQRVFIIIKNPQVLKELIENGVKLDQVNVGNLSMSEGARQIAKSVAVTNNDVLIFKYLNNAGVKLYHQMVPNDKKVDFMNLISEGK